MSHMLRMEGVRCQVISMASNKPVK